ncbi:nucleoplasmin-2a isoform X1 [Osmerus mordax]|uniref:nucleoplasmin-2a isoform X1 n=2 Tax=Osmerus mordax TaxID=8014 RepID=UPI0035108E27
MYFKPPFCFRGFAPMDLSTLSSVSDSVCVLWGCELKETQKKVVFDVEEDLLEHQFFIRTICLSAEATVEMHVVEVNDRVGVYSDLVPIATLHPLCQPMVSFSGFELTPPVTFQLRSGPGPLFITGQHVTLTLEDEEEFEPRNVFTWMQPHVADKDIERLWL